jgi:hypothetical protein
MLQKASKELLDRDRYYLSRASNVTEEERRLVENTLARGEQIYPDVIRGKEIFCPIWRIRLHKLGREAQDIVRQMKWELDTEKNNQHQQRYYHNG